MKEQKSIWAFPVMVLSVLGIIASSLYIMRTAFIWLNGSVTSDYWLYYLVGAVICLFIGLYGYILALIRANSLTAQSLKSAATYLLIGSTASYFLIVGAVVLGDWSVLISCIVSGSFYLITVIWCFVIIDDRLPQNTVSTTAKQWTLFSLLLFLTINAVCGIVNSVVIISVAHPGLQLQIFDVIANINGLTIIVLIALTIACAFTKGKAVSIVALLAAIYAVFYIVVALWQNFTLLSSGLIGPSIDLLFSVIGLYMWVAIIVCGLMIFVDSKRIRE